jgi:hypothetical protein
LFVQVSGIVKNKRNEAPNNDIQSICSVSASDLLRNIQVKETQTNLTPTYNWLRETCGWVGRTDVCLLWN